MTSAHEPSGHGDAPAEASSSRAVADADDMRTTIDRLVQLLDYVRDTSAARARPVSNITDHGLFLLFDHELAGIDARVNGIGRDAEDEVWLCVPRSPGPGLPPGPHSPWLAPWLAAGDGVLAAPRLLPWVEGGALIASGTHRDCEQAGRTGEAPLPAVHGAERVELERYAFRAEVERAHQDYLAQEWMPWSERERQRRRLARLYVRLFTLYQQLSGSMVEDPVELVVGMGMGVVGTRGTPLAYPVLTQAVDLRLDIHSGALEIRPKDAAARVDLAFYACLDQHRREAAARAVQAGIDVLTASGATPSPFEPDSYRPVLAAVRAGLTGDDEAGRPREDGETPATGTLEIAEGWVLFARPRNTSALDFDLQQLRERIQAAQGRLPPALVQLVRAPTGTRNLSALPDFRGLSSPAASLQRTDLGAEAKPLDLYFPNPFNEEQFRVAQLLEQHDAVVVEGPPGTGKTHTIANIVCHCLATGRRVLVTSVAEPALAVLQEKLPEEIRPLALSLTGSAHDGLRRFEDSLRHIARNLQSIDPGVLTNEVSECEGSIDALHARLARLDTEIGRWARLNQMRINIDADTLSPMDAAQEVTDHRGEYEWLPDALGIGAQYTPRFTDEDVDRLRTARQRLGSDIGYVGSRLPQAGDFPAPRVMLALHQGLAAFARLGAEVRDEPVQPRADADGPLHEMTQVIDDIERLRHTLGALDGATRRAVDELAAGADFPLLQALATVLDALTEERRPFLARPVELPASPPADPALLAAVAKLAEGHRPFSFIAGLGKGEIRRRLDAIRVSGQAPAGPADWAHVGDHLAWRQRLAAAAARWNALAATVGVAAVPPGQPEAVLNCARLIVQVRAARTLLEAQTRLADLAAEVFPAWHDARHVAHSAAAFARLQRALRRHQAARQMADAWMVKSRLQTALEGRSGPVVDLARDFLSDMLGNPAVDERLLLDRYAGLTAELLRLHALTADLHCVHDVTARIAQSGAPRYAEQLRRPHHETGNALLPGNWRRAWRWRSLATHLELIDPQDEFKRHTRLRAELERDLARAYRDLTVKRVWLRLAGQLTPQVRAGLQAYLNALQHIGAGSGRGTARHRRDARAAAAAAQAAVPCWIMAHQQVCETLPAQIGMFDLVIIDEASQSDLSALPVLLRGRKWLIVGDDKQVSPEPSGLDETRIVALMQRHLHDQVPLYRAQMSPDRSLYDLAKVAFASSCVALKEHFRCVEPIIEYARKQFYQGDLHPLRLPLPAERLDPALVDMLIAPARRKGDVNAAEARCIVDEVKRITADAVMQGRTIGVISLLGDEQALRIWEMLNDELGPETLQRFDILCGDARAFQGRERDIVFLSMVSAPNDPGGPLAREAFAQRFNVAASRARDRMVLVRSVELRHLHPGDWLRRSLIEHFTAAHATPGAPQDLRGRCESPLERELFDWLRMRGYRVVPHAQVGNRHIDLLVEGGAHARLAIECDGDKHHGPDKWSSDVRWQRVLERLGWTVWRCFAASTVRRRDSVFADLERMLTGLGITPAGIGIYSRPPADAGDGMTRQ